MQTQSYKTFPNCLRRYRKVRGLSQRQVAAILGMEDGSMISRWENGSRLPSVPDLFRLALIYRTMVDALYIDLRRSLREEVREQETAVLGP